ncbi:MAG TPA: DUF3237 domain-containing protein [Ramlibacter sp.]|uniref:DUF3237 domain-containing protein n=1 Tax=Ramlibacter sp. TaxID=1917967 RepID=UPI002CFBBB9F|nr:DUF3237 domain-containing protein [Ramlibacter sp.]HVZ45678.1 DUF3237 domain-containing protein [Ramlibacter sp.]
MNVPTPSLVFFADAQIEVGAPQEAGRGPHGVRRLIPILAGEFRGNGWRARVLPGGADFQLLVSDTLAELDARYMLETDAGERIYVVNRAVRAADPQVMAQLVRGVAVDPSLVYFRCAPSFETASKSLAWINERLFVGSGVRTPDRVLLKLCEVA